METEIVGEKYEYEGGAPVFRPQRVAVGHRESRFQSVATS